MVFITIFVNFCGCGLTTVCIFVLYDVICEVVRAVRFITAPVKTCFCRVNYYAWRVLPVDNFIDKLQSPIRPLKLRNCQSFVTSASIHETVSPSISHAYSGLRDCDIPRKHRQVQSRNEKPQKYGLRPPISISVYPFQELP